MNLIKKTYKFILPTMLTLVLLGFVFVAQKADALTISPARMELSGDPGTTITKDITLFNDSITIDQTFYISYANFEAKGETGAPNFVAPKDDIGTWMKTISDIVTIPAGESIVVSVAIDIPEDAYAGGHFGVVFFGTNPNDGKAGQVSVGAKTGSLILLTVSGDVLMAGGVDKLKTYKEEADNKQIFTSFFKTLPVNFEYRFKNDGNDRVKPEGNIVVRNLFFIKSADLEANASYGNILPKSTRAFQVKWLKSPNDNKIETMSFINRVGYEWNNFALGPYKATLHLIYGAENTSKTIFFFVFPWELSLIILIILLIVYFVGKLLLKKYNSHIIEKARSVYDAQKEVNNG